MKLHTTICRRSAVMLAAACGWLLTADAGAELKWLSDEYDFGAFRESAGPQTGSVMFVNEGKEAAYIMNVRPSCGCTSVDFPREAVAPGDTASISFTYDPAGRPGPFDKTVKVYMGKDNSLKVIRMTGTVIGSPETLEFSYPHEAGPLRFETLVQGMGEVKRRSTRHVFINIYNQGNDTVRPVWRCDSKALDVNLTPRALAPGEIGTFGFYLDAAHEKREGAVDYSVEVSPGKDYPEEDTREISISAAIVPDSRSLSAEEIERSPRAYLVPEFIDLGESVSGDGIPFTFGVLNDGRETLEVNRVYSRAGEVTLNTFTRKVKGGERGKVDGILDATKLPSGPFRLRVEVVTNDPLHPVRTADIVGVRP